MGVVPELCWALPVGKERETCPPTRAHTAEEPNAGVARWDFQRARRWQCTPSVHVPVPHTCLGYPCASLLFPGGPRWPEESKSPGSAAGGGAPLGKRPLICPAGPAKEPAWGRSGRASHGRAAGRARDPLGTRGMRSDAGPGGMQEPRPRQMRAEAGTEKRGRPWNTHSLAQIKEHPGSPRARPQPPRPAAGNSFWSR